MVKVGDNLACADDMLNFMTPALAVSCQQLLGTLILFTLEKYIHPAATIQFKSMKYNLVFASTGKYTNWK